MTIAAIAALLLGAVAVFALFLIAERIHLMADSLSASFAEITSDLTAIIAGLQQIAQNIINNPDIPPGDVAEAQGFATQLDAVAATVAGLETSTGGTGGGGTLPIIQNLTPPGGPISGGTPVTLIGTGFTGATAVNFGTAPATALVVSGDTAATCQSPSQPAGNVGVTIVTPNGTSAPVSYSYS